MRRHEATVLDEPRRGYGAACLRGLDHLRGERFGIVVFLDADYRDYPGDGPALRTHGPAIRLIRILFGVRFTDLGLFRAVRFDRLLQLDMRD